ncbi:MAG: hypothetical protein KAJ49_01695 [Arcobacteraceae bacterium]|nr:hypothetical protein [Arcobacteraceae bacterium]
MSQKTNELYLLVTVSNNEISNARGKAIKTSYKNDPAMYQKFKASTANGELDKELEKSRK